MSITVKFFANFSEAAGKNQEVVCGNTDLASLLELLARKYGNNFVRLLYSEKEHKIRTTVAILINGRRIDLNRELKVQLKDGDVLAIFPPVAGGWR